MSGKLLGFIFSTIGKLIERASSRELRFKVSSRQTDSEGSPGMRGLYALLLAAMSFPTLALAQTLPSLENGFKAYGSYDGSQFDTVNLQNGNLMLHLPIIPDAGQRGGRLGLNYALYVTSKDWMQSCKRNACIWTLVGGGVSLLHVNDVTVHRKLFTDSSSGSITYSASGYSVLTGDGATHKLYTIPGTTTEFESVDGSGYHVSLSNTDAGTGLPGTAVVIDRHGTRYEGNFAGQGPAPAVRDLQF